MHLRIQIKNVTMVNEGRRFLGTLVIDDNRIEEIIEGPDRESSIPVDETIDGTGCYVFPGVIDDHVHFRDPGLTAKGDFCSESRAAAAAGYVHRREDRGGRAFHRLCRYRRLSALCRLADGLTSYFLKGVERLRNAIA